MWGCKVKLPNNTRHAILLRVPWPGNVREAEARAAALQREVDAGMLNESIRWMGAKAAETLRMKLGIKADVREDEIREISGDPATWWEARSLWLSTYTIKKTVVGKINDVDLTRRGYEHRTANFCRWADEVKLPFKGKSATTAAVLFLRARKLGGCAASLKGVSLGTLDHDVRVLHTWFAWLHRRGIYDKLDKDLIYEDEAFGGDEDGGENFIPDWKLDYTTLKKMHETRFDSTASLAAWKLYVLVRGLGCRPKEAFTLSWDTVHVEEGLVVFKNTKEEKLKSKRRGASRRASRDRTVPIVFQWVQDALTEIKSLGGKRGTAVAVNTDGNFYKGPAQVANVFGRHLREIRLKRKGYSLKACQRAGLVHLEQFLPPWVVARIAGHSLEIHMNRYSTNNSHLPTQKARNYQAFDVLSAAGKDMREKHRSPSMMREMTEQQQA